MQKEADWVCPLLYFQKTICFVEVSFEWYT